MLKCLIVDDEPLAIRLLSDYVEKTDGLVLAEAFTSAIKALHFVENEAVDLIFLDVQMPELTGIQFTKILNGRIPVILTTAYEKYALNSYDLEVYDYLLKPISFERFLISIQKTKKRLQTSKETHIETEVQKNTNERDFMFVKTEYKIQKIDFKDILFFESMSDYVRIHTKGENVMTLEKMKHFEATLPSDKFIRIHKSYLIALDKIDFIERNRVIIEEKYLPVGATYQKAFKEKINHKGSK